MQDSYIKLELVYYNYSHYCLEYTIRHGNGAGGDMFYLPRPYTILPYTYSLPYPYSTGIRNRISSMSPAGSGIPASSPQWIKKN